MLSIIFKLERKKMKEQVFIGSKISFKSLRDYIFDHKINKGDSVALNPMNYESILEEIRNSPEEIEIPINVLGVLLVKSDAVELGKIQVVKNEDLNS